MLTQSGRWDTFDLYEKKKAMDGLFMIPSSQSEDKSHESKDSKMGE
jgi:hypothetical protein